MSFVHLHTHSHYSLLDGLSKIKDLVREAARMEMPARSLKDKEPGIDEKRYHLTLLAENEEGYHNLIELVTTSHLEGFYYKPRVDKELLRKHSKGIIALSGCMGGEISRAIQSGNIEKAEAVIKEYREIFG